MENLHRDLIIETEASVLGDISVHSQSLGWEMNKCHSDGAFVCKSASLTKYELHFSEVQNIEEHYPPSNANCEYGDII